jgi:hypothetical protein
MKTLLTSLFLALMAPVAVQAAILYEAHNITWQGGASVPPLSLSAPLTKTDTYYIQYTVELTSSVPPVIPNVDPNNRNPDYPYVPQANSTNGGAAFLFYIGSGYNSDYLVSTGFTTSTWHSNQFSANDGASDRTSTGMVAQYSTAEHGVVKFQVGLTLNMSAGTYDYTVTKVNGSGAVLQSVTLSGLDLAKGNYWNNSSSFNNLVFQSSTSQLTARFDSIIVSTDPIPVPEPGSFALAGLGATLLWMSRRRRKG